MYEAGARLSRGRSTSAGGSEHVHSLNLSQSVVTSRIRTVQNLDVIYLKTILPFK